MDIANSKVILQNIRGVLIPATHGQACAWGYSQVIVKVIPSINISKGEAGALRDGPDQMVVWTARSGICDEGHCARDIVHYFTRKRFTSASLES